MVGIKPRERISRTWSPKLAYAIGLLATDGCLSKDGRHIDLTSKDTEQLKNFLRCLGLKNKIGKKISGYSDELYSRIQFGDVVFYRFLLGIGLTPAKSKTMGALSIPRKYFFDFLRGSFDGDGTFYSYHDPRWRSSHMFYTVFISSSLPHIEWLRRELSNLLGVAGHITHDGRRITYQLKYAKRESLKILARMYYNKDVVCLSRKFLKVQEAIKIDGKKLFMRGW